MLDLTQGNVAGRLLKFSLPFLISTIIQAVINLSDILILSIFTNDSSSVAGVGIAAQISYLIINAVVGLTAGAGILVSQHFGAKDHENMTKTINTMFSLLTITALILSIALFFSASSILKALKTPLEAQSEAKAYLQTTMLGALFIFIYNGISAVLRGLGDSIRPLIFIGTAAIINIGLDILAVSVLNMKAFGVALATTISQLVLVLISGIYFFRKKRKLNIKRYKFELNLEKTKEILRIGVPTSVQNTIASLSFLVLTYIINITFDKNLVYALSAASVVFKVNSFAVLPVRSMNTTIAAMVGQNKGANDLKRIVSTFKYGLLFSIIFGLIFFVITFFFARQLLEIFRLENKSIGYGILYLKTLVYDYLILPYAVSQYGLVDGLGKTKVSMWINTISSIFLRVPLAFIFANLMEMGMAGVGLAIPISSLFSALAMFIYIRKKVWRKLKDA
ncbi:MAG: MATE family efflux transporter [Bacillota bacterium]|mgnify:CR=1 FL=1|jgi:putative MATE family efflux protein|nr:MATE family efflux transporter [Bacillota bacterium]HHU42767.1 MATE family efflux transporter [Clostridiales bacterium]